MATTITRATLGDKAPIFIRDVLRENLTDRQASARAGSLWIFKSTPDKLQIDFPYVMIELTTDLIDNLSLNRTKAFASELTFDILVYASKIADRDILSDEVVSTLRNTSSTDGTDSILSKQLFYTSSTQSTEDVYISNYPNMVRAKRITITMMYGGA